MSLVDADARALRDLRVPFIAGVPGSGSSYELLDACERAGIPFVSTAHEAAGAIMAGAAARQSNGFGAALSIKGPGVANLLGGLALARFENYRLLSFAEAYPLDADPGFQHKRMPQDAALQALVKGIFYCAEPGVVRQMADLAAQEPAGPVHLNLAQGRQTVRRVPARVPDSATLAALLDRIGRSSRPIMICGSALTRIGPSNVQRPAVHSLSIPIFTTAAAKGVVDERSDCCAGVFTGAGGELAPEQVLIPCADLIIGVALRNSEVLAARRFAAPYVSADMLESDYQKGFEPELHYAGDLQRAVQAIVETLGERTWGLEEVERAHRVLQAHLDTVELLPAPIYARLSRIAGAPLVTDSGNFTIVAEHLWRTSAPADFLGSSNGRYMGVALPQAIGVALQDPTRPVLCTVGDGGLPPYIAELRLAIARRLPLLVVLMSDGFYGSMRARIEERQLTDVGIRISGASWQRSVEGLGCPAVRVTKVAEFEAAVERWQPASGPMFVEAVMPDRAYVAMVQKLRL